jgi:sporulation protein YlmC with PRC-barrel domain
VSLSGVNAFGLISSDDVLPNSPSFKFGGMADGAGITINKTSVVNKNLSVVKGKNATITGMHNPEGTYIFLTNHEDNLGISRQFYDHTFKPIKGDWVVNSNAGYWRLCSATMATPEEHGFGPVFFSGGESGAESLVLAVDPMFSPAFRNVSPGDSTYWSSLGNYMYSWGRWSTENAVPIHKDAFPGKVVIILGDDDFEAQGQVVMIVGDLVDFQNKNYNNVKVYVMKRAGFDFTTLTGNALKQADFERGMSMGNTYDVEFVEITSITGKTGAQINASCDALHAIRFGRVEDIDYRRSMTNPGAAGREIYFNVTGQEWGSAQNPIDVAMDAVTMTGWWNGTSTGYGKNGYTNFSTSLALPSMYVYTSSGVKTQHGRVYKLVLDATNHLRGTLSVIVDADVRNSDQTDIKNYIMNVDNLVVTEDYIYIQEDPNRYSAGGTRTDVKRQFLFNYENHDSRIYQYNINTGAMSVLLEQDHRRLASDNLYYNQSASGGGSFANPNPTGTAYRMSIPGDWEFGAMVDVSHETGVPGSYILCNQPHSWQSLNYIRPDGGSRPTPQGYRLEASNLIMLSGIPQKIGGTGFSIAPESPTWYWFTTSVGGTPIASGKDFMPAITSDTTFYVAYGTTYAKSPIRESVRIQALEAPATTTGLDLLEGISEFKVFPNPNDGTFTLIFDSPISQSLKIEIIDINGKLIYMDYVSTTGLYKKSISIPLKGTYVASVLAGSKKVSKKIVVE